MLRSEMTSTSELRSDGVLALYDDADSCRLGGREAGRGSGGFEVCAVRTPTLGACFLVIDLVDARLAKDELEALDASERYPEAGLLGFAVGGW